VWSKYFLSFLSFLLEFSRRVTLMSRCAKIRCGCIRFRSVKWQCGSVNSDEEISMLFSVRDAVAGVVGAGVLAGGLLIGPLPVAQAAEPAPAPAANNAVTMGWHGMDFPQGPWHHGHGWGHWKHWWHW
jgi:hypothetical protein